MWVSPQLTSLKSWENYRSSDLFVLQKLVSVESKFLKSVLDTFQNVFDTKPPPYRIIWKDSHPVINSVYLVAVAETQREIESCWRWLEENIHQKDLNVLSDAAERHSFVKTKLLSIQSSSEPSDVDFEKASRTWRKNFDLPESEELLNYFAGAYSNTGINQGWMYISRNYFSFYSFVLGKETKLLFEFKDIEKLSREKSRGGILNDAIKIILKGGASHFFCNLFHRDETFLLLERLCSDVIDKMFKNDPVSLGIGSLRDLTKEAVHNRKMNERFTALFAVLSSESILFQMEALFHMDAPSNPLPETYGRLYLSQCFLCYVSDQRNVSFAIALYTIRKVERVHHERYFMLSLETCHGNVLKLCLNLNQDSFEQFSQQLCENLSQLTPNVQRLSQFLKTCSSEALLANKSSDSPCLGLIHGYPPLTSSKEPQKLQAWLAYFRERGRNVAIVRTPMLTRLIHIGIPNPIRGEVWEVCSGSMCMRAMYPQVYESLLADNREKTSFAIEEIEKDLNRSLPEYPAFREASGINALRRVLVAYSWRDPELGYCQAMNLIVSALLIYMTEEQAFWTMGVLCDRIIPGYYTKSMIGAQVDADVFESFVEDELKTIYAQVKKHDIQLKVSCVTWFLSIFVNTFQLHHALRVIDCFFLSGPKILFQVGLAILKINEQEIIKATDDGCMINIIKQYLGTLDDFIDNNPSNATNFDKLLFTALREFSNVTNDRVLNRRQERQLKVAHGIEQFNKRSVIRNLENTCGFTRPQLERIFDSFSKYLYYESEDNRKEERLGYTQFCRFIGDLAPWARQKASEIYASPKINSLSRSMSFEDDETRQKERRESGLQSPQSKTVGSHVICRIFLYFVEKSKNQNLVEPTVLFQDVLIGLSMLAKSSFEKLTEIFFALHDSNSDGFLTKDEITLVSESFLFFFRDGDASEDEHLGSVSKFLRAAYLKLEEQSDLARQGLQIKDFQQLLRNDKVLNDFFSGGLKFMFTEAERKPPSPKMMDTLIKKTKKIATRIQANVNEVQEQMDAFAPKARQFIKQARRKKVNSSESDYSESELLDDMDTNYPAHE